MKKIYTAKNPLDAHLLKGVLSSYNIDAHIRGESLFAIRGEIPVTEDTLPTVWVDDAVPDETIAEIVATFDRPSPHRGHEEGWRCGSCGEYLDPQFSSCWKCGHERGA